MTPRALQDGRRGGRKKVVVVGDLGWTSRHHCSHGWFKGLMWPGRPFVNEGHDWDGLLEDNGTGHEASFKQSEGWSKPGVLILMRGISLYVQCPRMNCVL